MPSTLLIVLPIFALILTGWVARRTGALGEHATREVNRLVVYLALPALLFDIMANAEPAQIWQPGFIAAFGLGCGVVFFGTLAFSLLRRRGLADAAIEGLNASYANTGFIGFPLIVAVVGASGLGPTLVATILTVTVLFGVAIVLIELGTQSGGHGRDVARRTLLAVVTNPLLIAPTAGAVVMLAGWSLPAPVQSFLDLLGGAASPCALIALGLFLAGSGAGAARPGEVGVLVGLKLLAQPAATWVFAGPVLGLPAELAYIAVLLAALPAGTGPFMLAELYGRGAATTSRVVLLTTVLSVVTLSAFLYVVPVP
jgi:predicted permease